MTALEFKVGDVVNVGKGTVAFRVDAIWTTRDGTTMASLDNGRGSHTPATLDRLRLVMSA